MARPSAGDYGAFYANYIALTEGEDVLEVLENSEAALSHFFTLLRDTDLQTAYAPEKWTIAQVLQHMIDTERIFAYRALCIARGEQQPLPGFDENSYARAAPAAGRKWKGLTDEFKMICSTTLILFRSIDKEQKLNNRGVASNQDITVHALGFIIAGHRLHHIQIIKDRYTIKNR